MPTQPVPSCTLAITTPSPQGGWLFGALWAWGLVYQVAVHALWLLTWPYWCWHPKRKASAKAQWGCLFREQQQRLVQWQQEARPLVWAHAVSVGETLTLLPALQAWLQHEETHPAAALWFTTTTQTGQQVALQQWQASPVLQAQALLGFLPHESWWAMHRLQCHLKPSILLLMETELWPGLLLWQALLQRVPVVLVNGRLSQRSFGGYWWLSRLLGFGWVLRHTLAAAWMQSPEDAARLQALGLPAERCEVMGTLKWATPPAAPL